MKLGWTQLGLNFLWSPVFFSAHQIGLALAIVLVLLGTVTVFICTAWRRDLVAAWLFVPYAAWVVYTSALNASTLAFQHVHADKAGRLRSVEDLGCRR